MCVTNVCIFFLDRRSVGWKAYVMNLSFYMLFLLLLTSMTVLLDTKVGENLFIDIPKYTIMVMSLFHLLKELFQIWDEVSIQLICIRLFISIDWLIDWCSQYPEIQIPTKSGQLDGMVPIHVQPRLHVQVQARGRVCLRHRVYQAPRGHRNLHSLGYFCIIS